MICKKCGKEIEDNSTVCKYCGFKKVSIDTTDEIESLINEIIDEEDSESSEEKISENYEERKTKRDIKICALNISKVCIIICIMVYFVTMFFNWFNLGGNSLLLGINDLDDSIMSNEYNKLSYGDKQNYNGIIVELSPIKLVIHSINNFNTYKNIYNSQRKEKVSIFSWLNMINIWLFILAIILCVISIIILIVSKKFKFIRFVKNSSFIVSVIIIFNYIAIKIPFLSMVAINAQSVLRKENIINAVKMTKEGIAVNNSFYPYYLELGRSFYVSIISIAIWIAISTILTEIVDKNKD